MSLTDAQLKTGDDHTTLPTWFTADQKEEMVKNAAPKANDEPAGSG